MNMTKYLGKSEGILIGETNVYIHEKNYGYLISEKTLPPQFTPCKKHCAANTIWFREEVVKCEIKLCKVYTVEKLRDISTKVWLVDIFSILFCCHPLKRKYSISIPPHGSTG